MDVLTLETLFAYFFFWGGRLFLLLSTLKFFNKFKFYDVRSENV